MSETAAKPRSRVADAFIVVGGMLALMWVLEGIDTVTLNALDSFGVQSRVPASLVNVLWSPFLHFGWPHLIGNSVPFLVLGVLTYLSGPARWLFTTVFTTIVSGLFAWLLSPLGTITAGASGLIFGYLTYLLARGIYTRKLGQILVSVVVFLAYGSVLLGVLPTQMGVSWQAHLGGAIAGVASAWYLHGRDRRRSTVA